ncbi:MAG TPA: ABC transporter transmembrane domain-containing protein [Casimicrobiaceae bacterium]|nr:ABC transporter transmembrane domain-containing protein [Casimicrobiaceae bacterium]
MKHTAWWSPPQDTVSREFVRVGMPANLLGFIRRVSSSNQLWIALLAVTVFVMNTAPLEIQRRILNAATIDRDARLVVVLGLAYAAIVVSEGLLKLLLNVYGGWIGEKAIRTLRLSASTLADGIPAHQKDPAVQGVEISLIVAEPEAIGGFVGIAVAELVLQVGMLLSVFGYMFYVQPTLALVCLLLFAPQLLFVPLMQSAINRRAQARIGVLRQASVGVLLAGQAHGEKAQRERFAEIFELDLGIVKLRFSMKFLMNFTQNLGKVLILCFGGWYIIEGRTDIGTVVAFVSGLASVRDPWSDLVNWYQEMMLASAKYRTFVAAMRQFAIVRHPFAAD